MTNRGFCDWCGQGLTSAGRLGRPRRYCRRSHRQRAYEARRVAKRMGLDGGEALVSAEALGDLRVRLRAVRSALRTVERDLGNDDDYAAAFRHLYAATVGLGEVGLEPIALLGPGPGGHRPG